MALEFVRKIRVAHNATPLSANSATWEVLRGWVSGDDRIVGTHVPDALLAAVAASHGARLATNDRGFARYPVSNCLTPEPKGDVAP